jgi:CDP-diacylglycerol---glycerol-3-phosphate 3-phosphatidyltransferase
LEAVWRINEVCWRTNEVCWLQTLKAVHPSSSGWGILAFSRGFFPPYPKAGKRGGLELSPDSSKKWREMKEDLQKKVVLNLPNALTLVRFATIPLVILFLSLQGRWGSFLAALFFGIAFLTDILDGYFARRYGEITILGKLLDPLADKILVCSTLIMLIAMGRAPAWIVMLIIVREMAITGLRGIAVSQGMVIQASSLGKYKTVFQSIATIFLCLHYEYMGIDFHAVGIVFLGVGLLLTWWSGWGYFKGFYKSFFA